jgi:riboflavin kinase / FMN adenylyltransferase
MSRASVALGVFDGVHLGHRQVLRALRGAGTPRVVTLDPHPVAGTPLLCSVERRVELLGELGADVILAAPGAIPNLGDDAILVAGPGDDIALPRSPDVRVPLVEGVSSALIRRLVAANELEHAARLLGRPFELEGVVVEGDARGRDLGFPTANLALEPRLLVPPNGIYAGAALGHRAAISIGVNPHYGGHERRVEAFLLDFDGDLYGERLRLELWTFLRDEAAFDSERELVAQISRDVEATRTAIRPSTA